MDGEGAERWMGKVLSDGWGRCLAMDGEGAERWMGKVLSDGWGRC